MELNRFFFRADDCLSPMALKKAQSQYGTLLVGIDPGDTDKPSETAQPLINTCNRLGIAKHFYLVGPGDTGWSPQEAAQVRYMASKVSCTGPSWHAQWLSHGWQDYVFSQIDYYFHDHQAYSVEIDNLSVAGIEGDKLVSYFHDLALKLRIHSIPTKLMLKNLSADELALLEPSPFFAPWGIFEEGSGDPAEQERLCAALGIYAVTPRRGLLPTHNYGCPPEGVPRLQEPLHDTHPVAPPMEHSLRRALEPLEGWLSNHNPL